MSSITEPCPFCGSYNIHFSTKTMGDHYDKEYNLKMCRRKVSMYCADCNTYGPRTLIEAVTWNGSANEGIEKAIELWNSRS